MEKPKYTESIIVEALARSVFPWRQFLLCPNIYFSFGRYEIDLLAITASGYAHEIEIKVTMADLKRDFEKRHFHDNARIKFFWYAIPEPMLESALPLIPETAGIITVRYDDKHGYYWPTRERPAKTRAHAQKLDDAEIEGVRRMVYFRYWASRLEHVAKLSPVEAVR